MVKKKSTAAPEKDRKVDEVSTAEDHSQKSDLITVDIQAINAVNNLEVMPVASSDSATLSIKRTRCRPQLFGGLRDPKLNAENDSMEIESTCQPVALHQITTRSATGRLAKRPKKELASQKSPPRKQAKDVQSVSEGGNMEPSRPRRPWELWGTEDKNLFFEALFEHGKDFDAIQNFMAQKHKKRGGTESAAKTKDQIRHFYYRTCHKIASYIDLPATDDVRKQALEIYGLVCYGELRRKGVLKMNKMGPKLNELLTAGNTIIRIRGKNQRVKVPICRALKRLHNIDEQRDESKLKLPEKVTVKLHPRTNSAWSHVQMLSQNPRLLINVQPDQHLSTIFEFLDKKWRLECLQIKEALGERATDPLDLRLHVPSECSLTPISINRSNTQPKLDFSFGNYLENVKSLGTVSSTSISPPNRRMLKVAGLRTEELASKNRLAAEATKSSPNLLDAGISEEERLKVPSALSLSSSSSSNSCVVQMTRTDENGLVTAVVTDANACDMNCSETDFFELNQVKTDTWPEAAVAEVSTLTNTAVLDAAIALDNGALSSSCTSAPATPQITTVPLNSVTPLFSAVAPLTSATAPLTSAAVPLASCNSLLVERLLGPIDRTLAEEVTVAELFIMAGRPKELTLDYDWVPKSSSVNVEEQNGAVGSALRHLVNIALTEFASYNRILPSGRLGAMSPPSTNTGSKSDANSSGTKSLSRSPRLRQNPGISRTRKDSVNLVPDASLDQSANYPWSNASTPVSSFHSTYLLSSDSLAPLYSFSPPKSSSTSATSTQITTVIYSNAAADNGNSPKTLMTPASDGVFRVPKKLPPKLQARTGESRMIVDKTVLDGLSIYSSKRSEFMPRKIRARNERKPLGQRTLLPKSPLQTSQIVTFTLVPGVSNAQTGSFLPVGCSTSLTSPLESTSPLIPTSIKPPVPVGDSQQNVIKMAPTELKSTGIRRIVPVPVPADSVAIFPAVDNLVSSSRNAVVTTNGNNVNETVHSPSEPILPMAITGIDAFLQSELQDAISVSQEASHPAAAHSFLPSLGDSNLSMPSLLEMALPEGGDSTDRFLDLELMNSNSSFTGLLNTAEEKNPSTSLALSNDDSLLNSVKNFQGIANSEEAVPWLNNEELSLSNFLPNFSSVNKDLDQSLSVASDACTISTPAIPSHVFISDNSRESSLLGVLNSVDSALQTMMNENSLDMASKLTEMLHSVKQQPGIEANGMLGTSKSMDHDFASVM